MILVVAVVVVVVFVDVLVVVVDVVVKPIQRLKINKGMQTHAEQYLRRNISLYVYKRIYMYIYIYIESSITCRTSRKAWQGSQIGVFCSSEAAV